MIRPLTALLTLCLLVPAVLAAPAAKRPASWCEEQWRAQAPDYLQRNDFNGLLARWQQLAPECRGTVAWESRLALVHSSLGDFAKARATLEGIDGLNSEYAWLAELMYLLNDSREHVATGRFDTDYAARLAGSWEEYIKAHPGRPEGYRELGSLHMLQGRYAEAVANLEKATAADSQVWLVFRDLTIGYTELGRYQEALLAAAEATAKRSDLTQDAEFILALGRANAGLGRFELAYKALELIAKLRPEVKGDPQYAATEQFIRAQEKGGKQR
ncbi:MAG: Tetratricopeptide repeat [Moraxellaceae bacterium]|jgi:tetratricopeptide (TPR) repeat protein|nr:Tetratricopeptide repeat [Moraxellaceae bacterium]